MFLDRDMANLNKDLDKRRVERRRMLERVRKQFDMRQADFRQRTGDPLGSSLICCACRKRVGIDSPKASGILWCHWHRPFVPWTRRSISRRWKL
jgi:hypothetical protein